MLNLKNQIEVGEVDKETARESIDSLKINHRKNIESILNDVQIEIMKIHNFLSYHWKKCAGKDDLTKEIIDDEEHEFEEIFELED